MALGLDSDVVVLFLHPNDTLLGFSVIDDISRTRLYLSPFRCYNYSPYIYLEATISRLSLVYSLCPASFVSNFKLLFPSVTSFSFRRLGNRHWRCQRRWNFGYFALLVHSRAHSFDCDHEALRRLPLVRALELSRRLSPLSFHISGTILLF